VPPPSPSPLDNVTESRVTKVNIIDELIQDLEQPDPEVRRRAIWELGQRGNSAAMQPLVGLLTQVDSREQSLILAALAEITSQTLKPMNRAVMIALQSEDAEVRKNAIRDLTKIFDSFKQSGKLLGHAALDEDPDVKQTADWALDQLNKMKPSSSKAAGFLGESDQPQRRLTDDGHSSS
jgi:HEAT repeat protein